MSREMRCIVMLAVVVAMMAAVMLPGPAFADAKRPHASCTGILASEWAPESFSEEPSGESWGEEVRPFAQEGGVGRFFNKENRAAFYGQGSPYDQGSPNC